MVVRKAVVAGQFYPADVEELNRSIKECFTGFYGPGELPDSTKQNNKIFGGIVPHAGYPFSGPCCAWLYKELAESKLPEVVFILGVNHSGRETCTSNMNWETPLGVVEIDTEIISDLEKNGLPIDNRAHETEHSIEVQLPFLQFVYELQNKKTDLKIVPIMIADSEYSKWNKIIRTVIDKSNKSFAMIASGDFTHYGWNYSYVPFEKNITENLKKLDTDAIKFIEQLDVAGFLKYITKTKATICGSLPFCVMIELAKSKAIDNVKLLKYYTSGDVLEDYENAVGYGSIVFR